MQPTGATLCGRRPSEQYHLLLVLTWEVLLIGAFAIICSILLMNKTQSCSFINKRSESAASIKFAFDNIPQYLRSVYSWSEFDRQPFVE